MTLKRNFAVSVISTVTTKGVAVDPRNAWFVSMPGESRSCKNVGIRARA
jgi:hypothetical protein